MTNESNTNTSSGGSASSEEPNKDNAISISSTASSPIISRQERTEDEALLPTSTTTAAAGASDSQSSSTSSAKDSSSSTTIRTQLGNQLSTISDIINDNLIIVRYGTISSVLLLGVYGIANTPLFYRYKNIMDIPTKMFVKRKWIHGRIVGLVENKEKKSVGIVGRNGGGGMSNNNWSVPPSSSSSSNGTTAKSSNSGIASLLSSSLQRNTADNDESHTATFTKDAQYGNPEQQNPIVLLFRHSSPMERLLSPSTMDKLVSFTGRSSSLLYSSANPHRNLLRVELAGVVAPPPTTPTLSTQSYPILNDLIQQKTKVSLQLLAQRTAAAANSSNAKHNNPNFSETNRMLPIMDDDEMYNTAICHLHYRQPNQWFFSKATNAALKMVTKGQAWINSCGMVVPLSDTTTTTTTTATTTEDNKFNTTNKNEEKK